MAVDGMGAEAAPAKREAKKEDRVSVLPVTVRLLEDVAAKAKASGAEGAPEIHGSEPGMLVIVGCVESMTKQTSSVEFVLNDATGRIRARYFGNEGDAQLSNVEVGKYVSAVGMLRTSPALHLSVQNVRFTRSADEISYHMIEAAHAMLKLTRPQPTAQAPTSSFAMIATPEPKKAVPAPVSDVKMEVVTPEKEQAAPAAFSAPAEAPAATAVAGKAMEGAPLRDAILKILKEEQTAGREEGMHKDALCARLVPTPQAQVVAAVQALVEGGDVYDTISEEHFACF